MPVDQMSVDQMSFDQISFHPTEVEPFVSLPLSFSTSYDFPIISLTLSPSSISLLYYFHSLCQSFLYLPLTFATIPPTTPIRMKLQTDAQQNYTQKNYPLQNDTK
jgi:hypothetical protein